MVWYNLLPRTYKNVAYISLLQWCYLYVRSIMGEVVVVSHIDVIASYFLHLAMTKLLLDWPSSANYGEAIEILKKRFGNRQMIISRHMEILLNLSAVSRQHDLRGLRQLYNEVEANVWSLKALGMEQDSYGTMLTSVLLTKLPPEIRLIVTRKALGEDLELETLQAAFEEELVTRERSRDPAQNNHRPHDKAQPPPTATILLSGTKESSRESIACCYCQQMHSSINCHVVTNLDARRQFLKSSARCFNARLARENTIQAFVTRLPEPIRRVLPAQQSPPMYQSPLWTLRLHLMCRNPQRMHSVRPARSRFCYKRLELWSTTHRTLICMQNCGYYLMVAANDPTWWSELGGCWK